MNEILSDKSWWNASKCQEAERRFSKVIVDAFYDDIQAGKTSLLQHFIFSGPEKDRFSSTSTAKTKISDIKVIPAERCFAAVVMFFSKHRVQANAEDCLADSCLAVWERAPDEKIINELLNHDDQKFRETSASPRLQSQPCGGPCSMIFTTSSPGA